MTSTKRVTTHRQRNRDAGFVRIELLVPVEFKAELMQLFKKIIFEKQQN